MRIRRPFATVNVLLPLIVGGLIYICWRDPDLFMFRWFDAVGLGPLTHRLRMDAATLEPILPYWFTLSLPDGLWVYALTAFMAQIWKGSSSLLRIPWLCLGLLLGAGSELGQLAGVVPGVFDIRDFLFCLAAAALALSFSHKLALKRSLNDATA